MTINRGPTETTAESIRPKTRTLSWTIPVLIVLGLVAFVRFPTIFSSASNDSPAVGKPAPQLDLVLVDSQPDFQRLQAYPSDSITVLHFWGTWCGPCRMEFPELAAMVIRHRDTPSFLFLPVSCEADSGETFDGLLSKTQGYFASEGIALPCLADPRGVTRRSLAQRLEGDEMVYPTTVVIDANGRIAGIWEGYSPASVDEIDSLVNRLLQQRVAPQEPS